MYLYTKLGKKYKLLYMSLYMWPDILLYDICIHLHFEIMFLNPRSHQHNFPDNIEG